MTSINSEELQAFLRNDFMIFIARSFQELNPHTEYLHHWYIGVIADALEQCRTGQINRLVINVPPRHLKSHVASIAFPAFVLGHNPFAQIICASYAQDLADKLAADCRSLMTSDLYRRVFPWTRLAGRSLVSDFSTTERGFRLSTSVGGVLTGRGADFIIIDDALKPDEALSETQRKSVNDWFDHTVVTRLNDKRSGCIILIAQRLHEDDLVGHVLRQGGWHHIKFPAIAEENESYTIKTIYGEQTFTRREGEALHPEREPLELLAQMRESLGEYNFAGQYQQSPSPLGGGMVKTSWFRTYTSAELPAEYELIFQSWDTANKDTELSDFSVCTTWGLAANHLYLLHVFRQRLNYPDLRRAVKQQAFLFHPKNIIIEDKASGTQLIQDLQEDGVHATTPFSTQMDKVMRMHSTSSTIENGFVHIPAQADWIPEYLHEISAFPKGKHDDQVDSTSQALHWVREGRDCLGYIDWLKQKAAEEGVYCTAQSGRATPLRKEPYWDPRASRNASDRRSTQIESRPCDRCGEIMNQRISYGLRCVQCGNQWVNPEEQPDIYVPNRTDLQTMRRFGQFMFPAARKFRS
jgi:predicted phage terminase large subunit-like protein